MSQQEFEPQQQPDQETYQPQYPYSWSDQPQQEGMPRDEPPINYNSSVGRSGYQEYGSGQTRGTQVPWWARPQPRQTSSFGFMAILALVILLTLVLGGLGVAGVVFGALLHILGVIIGAIFILLLFAFLLILLVLGLIGRTLRRAFGPPHGARGREWRGRW